MSDDQAESSPVVVDEAGKEGVKSDSSEAAAPPPPTEEYEVVTDKVELGNTVNVIDFFPGIHDDLSLVSWAHAVNSHTKLVDALNDPLVMMLEADVLSGKMEGSDDDTSPGPIMAHPPDTQSDLSLGMWMEAVIAANKEGKKKGVKLDFKDLSIVKESLQLLESYVDQINFPLWLNADILAGPVESTTTPLDPNEFLTLCVQYFPLATLSVGWTTRYTSADDEKGEYTQAMVQEMAKTLEAANIAQPVTFPIRAAFVGRSIVALEWLVDNVLDGSITVWSAPTDHFDPQAILALQDVVGMDAMYLDLPGEQLEALEEAREREEEQENMSKEAASGNAFPITTMATTVAIALASALAALYLYN